MRAYHFTGHTLRDGSPIPAIGVRLEHGGRLEPCMSGLHASRHSLDALQYAPGSILHLVEISGEIIELNDKLVASERTILKSIDATEIIRKFTRWCALEVISLWDAPDIVHEYLKTGDESKWDLANSAAREATLSEDRSETKRSIWYATRSAYRAIRMSLAVWEKGRDAARDASWDALWALAWCNAASDEARDPAWNEARAEARQKQRDKFSEMVDEEFVS